MDQKKLRKFILSMICLAISVIILVIYLLYRLLNPVHPKGQIENELSKEQEVLEDIEFTKYNEISYAYISDMQLCNIYLLDYKNNAIEHTKEAYDSLDPTYRQKRFGSYEDYQSYVQANADAIFNAKLKQYQVNHYDNFTQYICIDQYGNEYFFKETAIMKYTLILDSYTVELPQYIEKYNNSNEAGRVGMCIERFVKAIYEENYTFAYSVLASGFKENYFKTQQEFETYIKQNFIKGKEIAYALAKQEGDLYIFETTITNSQNQAQSVTRNFIVRLGEGTNFELSFEIK